MFGRDRNKEFRRLTRLSTRSGIILAPALLKATLNARIIVSNVAFVAWH